MYYLVYGLLFLLSLLPMGVLYVLSDFLYVLLYRIFGYRRRVVLENLRSSFPEKSEKEIQLIAKKFYHQFFDSFIETIKLLSCSTNFLEKRLAVNWDEAGRLYGEGLSSQIHLGHNFNWEWGAVLMSEKLPQKVSIVYMPIANKSMDRLFLKMRRRTGTVLVPATPTEAFRKGLKELKTEIFTLVLVADQSPGDPTKAYWLNFFGKPTAFVAGPEKSARLNKLPVMFTAIKRKKRGNYEAIIKLITKEPRNFKDGELTVMFARFLEDVIQQQPENWLWSHRRWKREWKPEYKDLWIDDPAKMPSF
jgi:KDO2-lipid IV(A) lauroyltransferase